MRARDRWKAKLRQSKADTVRPSERGYGKKPEEGGKIQISFNMFSVTNRYSKPRHGQENLQ